MLQKVLDLYKSKHPKKVKFLFICCGLVLKEIPCWAKIIKQNKIVATMKRKVLKTTKSSKNMQENVNFVENSKDFKVHM